MTFYRRSVFIPENVLRKKHASTSVCLCTHHFHPLYSGPGRRTQQSGPSLTRRGIRMHVFTRAVTPALLAARGSWPDAGADVANDSPRSARADWPLYEVVNGLPVYRTRLPEGPHRSAVFFHRLAGHCREHRTDIDVVQFMQLRHMGGPSVRRIRRLGLSTMFSCTLLGDLAQNPLKNAIQRFDRRLPMNQMDVITVHSGVMRRYIEDLGVTKPIRVIPIGVDLGKFHPSASAEERLLLRRRLNLDLDAHFIVSIGAIRRRKGTDVLVAAFLRLMNEFPRARLLLIGPLGNLSEDGADGFQRRLRETISKADARDRIVFTGVVSNTADYLRAADLFVFPSRREGLPAVVPEAMATGLPVITTPFLGISDELGVPGRHYQMSSWDSEALAADMRRLLSDGNARRGLGLDGRRWVQQHLDVDDSLDRYAELYHELGQRSTVKR